MAARKTQQGWVGQRWAASVVPAAPYGWGVLSMPVWGGAPRWVGGFRTRAAAESAARAWAAR